MPLVFLWAVYGQSLGSDALSLRLRERWALTAGKTGEGSAGTRPAAEGEASEVTLLDLEKNKDALLGQRVITEGMVSNAMELGEGGILLFRFVITCCVADAQPVGVLVFPKEASSLPDDTWVRVQGVFEVRTVEGEAMASLRAEKVERIETPPPAKRYLFN
jgi:uncharacterized repeat protein (TIGR03943 family)